MESWISAYYRKFRRSGMGGIVGQDASMCLRSARILDRWQDLENAGLVRIRTEFDTNPDPSFYDTWPHLSERTREALKEEYCNDCYGVIAEFRADRSDEWEQADSVWGCAGYNDPSSPFENCYVIDLMRAALKQLTSVYADK